MERDSAISEMEKLARIDGACARGMCELHFCSGCFVPNDVEAARWGIIAADLGFDPVGMWLKYLLTETTYDDDEFIPEMSPIVPVFCMDTGGKGQYRNTCGDSLELVEFQILKAITCTNDDGSTNLKEWKNDGYGFENDVFAFRRSDDIDYDFWTEHVWLANFIFKPAGFELDWYDIVGKNDQVNQAVSTDDIRKMLRFCIDSVRRDLGRREA